jgi:hypothetical protein
MATVTQEQVIDHMSVGPLVVWAWDPGAGRSTPSITDAQFIERPEASAKVGMPCPWRLNKHRQRQGALPNGLARNDNVLYHKIGLFKVGATMDIDVVARRFDRKVIARCHA